MLAKAIVARFGQRKMGEKEIERIMRICEEGQGRGDYIRSCAEAIIKNQQSQKDT